MGVSARQQAQAAPAAFQADRLDLCRDSSYGGGIRSALLWRLCQPSDRPTSNQHRKSLYGMKFNQLVVLLPCHSLEDFTLHRNAKDAEQLLASWSALWHPALLASAQSVPTWLPAETPPRQPAGYLFTLADCSKRLLPDGWLAEAEAAGSMCWGAFPVGNGWSPPRWSANRVGTAARSIPIWRPISWPWGSATFWSSC